MSPSDGRIDIVLEMHNLEVGGLCADQVQWTTCGLKPKSKISINPQGMIELAGLVEKLRRGSRAEMKSGSSTMALAIWEQGHLLRGASRKCCRSLE
jgi:hypothetical protein